MIFFWICVKKSLSANCLWWHYRPPKLNKTKAAYFSNMGAYFCRILKMSKRAHVMQTWRKNVHQQEQLTGSPYLTVSSSDLRFDLFLNYTFLSSKLNNGTSSHDEAIIVQTAVQRIVTHYEADQTKAIYLIPVFKACLSYILHMTMQA